MYLNKIKLTNFRNYENLELDVSKKLNVFFGNNAQGKTNIIEAIYMSSITKSYRTQKDTECIKFEENFLKIETEYIYEDKNVNVEVYLDDSKKIVKENKIKVEKYSDYIGEHPVVLFCPENMEIVKGAPKNRRRYLDILLSQISKKYVISLQEYNKLLKMKNNLLKNDVKNIDENYLDILDTKLAEKIEVISNMRAVYVDKVEKYAAKIQLELSKKTENIKIKYISEFVNMNFEKIKEELKKCRQADIIKKSSTKGLGHDDMSIIINDTDVSLYGSQGQNRTALLSLKLAEFEILKEEKENTPIILLDDVFSELDTERINFLLNYIENFQVFITSTEIDSIKEKKETNIFKVDNAKVEKIIN